MLGHNFLLHKKKIMSIVTKMSIFQVIQVASFAPCTKISWNYLVSRHTRLDIMLPASRIIFVSLDNLPSFVQIIFDVILQRDRENTIICKLASLTINYSH